MATDKAQWDSYESQSRRCLGAEQEEKEGSSEEGRVRSIP